MQEVVGSSPIIRLKSQEIWGFRLANEWGGARQTFCMHLAGSAQGLGERIRCPLLFAGILAERPDGFEPSIPSLTIAHPRAWCPSQVLECAGMFLVERFPLARVTAMSYGRSAPSTERD
jgi:hypothetical protein